MRTITIVAMAFLFVLVAVQGFAQADEMKPQIVETQGEANAKAETAKDTKEIKALAKAQGNQVKGTMEQTKRNTKPAGESEKGSVTQPKAKTE